MKLSEESITEHLAKARRKIDTGDHSGAIANAYTLAEEFLKALLRKTDTPFNTNEGDIRTLYKLVAPVLNLDPKGDTLENYLKAILDGLQRQLGGLFEVANKASDRHARRYNPAKHHAKLAVNAPSPSANSCWIHMSISRNGRRKRLRQALRESGD